VEEARKDSYREGYTAGIEFGKKEALKGLTVEAEWSLAKAALEHLLYTDPPKPQHSKNAHDQMRRLADSWRKMRQMVAWQDLAESLHRQYKQALWNLRNDNGAPESNRELMTFIEAIMNIPVLAAQYEQRMTEEPPENAQSPNVIIEGEPNGPDYYHS